MATISPGRGRPSGAPATATSPAPASGALLFGRYRLDERLGEGGMAEVWRAYDVQLERDVAVKLLHRHLLPDALSRERFAAEARAVAGLSHPGIVTVHDIVVDDNQAAMVLELVDGEPLSDVLAKRGTLPEEAAAAITAQVALALDAAHDRGLVHRDVKPANVLLSSDGRARLVDFGIARALDDHDHGLTVPGTIMGTLRYMAPEQLADGAADRATDVFGVGSLLYEMLVGRPPFPAATPAALMAQQRQGSPQIPTVSSELAGYARLALQHDPERRPRTAGKMAALLERWLDNRGISPQNLPAVVTVALSDGPMPGAAPGAGSADAPPVLPQSTPMAGTPDPAAVAAAVAAAAVAPPLASTAIPDPEPGWIDTAAITAPRTGVQAASGFGGRRVPLITAVGLAGLLVAALLLAGALTALQAGSARPRPSATTRPEASAPAVVATPKASPAVTPAPLRIIVKPPDHKKRDKDR